MRELENILLEVVPHFVVKERNLIVKTIDRTQYSIDLVFYSSKKNQYLCYVVFDSSLRPEYSGTLSYYWNFLLTFYEIDSSQLRLIAFCKRKDESIHDHILNDTRLNNSLFICEYKNGTSNYQIENEELTRFKNYLNPQKRMKVGVKKLIILWAIFALIKIGVSFLIWTNILNIQNTIFTELELKLIEEYVTTTLLLLIPISKQWKFILGNMLLPLLFVIFKIINGT